jgi:choline dehydrogenase
VAGEVREARAGRTVVVSAGAFNSPQLLELSGIGKPERLRTLGIAVRHELPGVGENLRDHYVPRTRWLVGKKGITFNDRGRGLGLAPDLMLGWIPMLTMLSFAFMALPACGSPTPRSCRP